MHLWRSSRGRSTRVSMASTMAESAAALRPKKASWVCDASTAAPIFPPWYPSLPAIIFPTASARPPAVSWQYSAATAT